MYRILYSFIFVHFLSFLFLLGSIFNKKIRKAFFDRRGLWSRYDLIEPKGNKKRIWFHVSSVGEMEQAKPVIRLFEKNDKDIEIFLTYFSPSAKVPASKISGLTFNDYLPLDTISNSKKVIKTIDPDVVVFVKFDIWPNIVWSAKKHGAKTVLIDGTLQRSSRRYSNVLGQSFYNSVYRSLDLIGAVSESDVNRFSITAPKHRNIKLLGDTRFDQVAFRANNAIRSDKIPASLLDVYRKNFTLICGSTWEADDKHILNPLHTLLYKRKDLKLVLVPHEPEQKRVENYMKYFQSFKPVRLSQVRRGVECSRVMIVDEVGALAELYMAGTLAYVGGAFSTGVHNVMEPAIMGLPVFFGPFYFNAPEAEELIKINCAFSGKDSKEFDVILNELTEDVQKTRMMGLKASEYIKSNLGADKRYYNELKDLLIL